MKLLQIILIIILLILSALLIAINLKLYRINDIKRGGQVSEDVLIKAYGDIYKSLSEADKSLFNVYLYDTIGIGDDTTFNKTASADLLNMWIESKKVFREESSGYRLDEDEDEDMKNAVAASLLDDNLPSQVELRSQVEYNRLYNLWIRSSSIFHSINPTLRKNIQIQYTFPNFFSEIIVNIIDINNQQLHHGLEVRRHDFKDSNIYFDIKYIIWDYCIKRGLIHDNAENRNCFFLNAELDACDLNGWILQSFTHISDIYTFIMGQIDNMDKIVFIPRSDKSMGSFVKNIIFGRMEIMGKPNSEELIHARYYGSRQVFGDGNCYYTAFMFNLLEFALFSGHINGIRQRIAKNIIDALTSVQSDIQKEILIYDRESGNNYTIPNNIMQTNYTFMLAKLTTFFEEANSIFELERLFNEQNPNNGDLVGICLPLVYGCKLLIAKYMVDNYASTPEGMHNQLSSIVSKDHGLAIVNAFNKTVLQQFLATNILRIYYDMAEITELPILAYSFKCKQLLISDDNLQHPYVNYIKYKDPYTLIERSFQLIGATNLILRTGAFHYDIVYHYSNTTIPNPIFPLYKEKLIPAVVKVDSTPLPATKMIAKYSEQIVTKEQIMNALLTLSYTDLDKLIECKKKRIIEYKNLPAFTYYVGDTHQYTAAEENDKNKLNEQILELAESIKLRISQAIEYYNMQDIVTNDNDKDRFMNLLRTLKVEIDEDEDEDDKIIIKHHSGAPIITKERVRTLFLEHSDI